MILAPIQAPDSLTVPLAFDLNVTIAYQSATSHDKAVKTLEGIRTRLCGQAELIQTAWKLDLLQFPSIRKLAVLDAIEADLIILSLETIQAISAGFGEWLAEWPPTKTNQPSALIGLLPPLADEASCALASQLESICSKCRMALFLNHSQEHEDQTLDTIMRPDNNCTASAAF